MPFTS